MRRLILKPFLALAIAGSLVGAPGCAGSSEEAGTTESSITVRTSTTAPGGSGGGGGGGRSTTAGDGTTTTAGTSTSSSAGSGVRGQVTAGPTCPVQQENDPSCADRPIAARVTIRDVSGSAVARRDTGSDGTYSAPVPPGRYTVEATSQQAMSCTPTEVTVPAGGWAQADVSCDTGIR